MRVCQFRHGGVVDIKNHATQEGDGQGTYSSADLGSGIAE